MPYRGNSKTKKLDEERRRLVIQNLDLARGIASKMAMALPRHIDYEDILHDGFLGLIDAAFKYSRGHRTEFSTYATIRIRGSILDSLRSRDWVPRRVRQMSKKIDDARDELGQQLRREPSCGEISEFMRIPRERIHQIMLAVKGSNMISLEDLQASSSRRLSDGDGSSGILRDQEPFEGRIEMKEQLKDALSTLNEKEKSVIILHYLCSMTLQEIRHTLSLSEFRIYQIHTSALTRLRARLHGPIPFPS